MSISSSLRRSLRRIPEFRSLPADRLEVLAGRMECREYRSGELIWRTGSRTDFVGIVQRGELHLERRIRGAIIHSTRLSRGDLLVPGRLAAKNSRSSVLIRSVTEAQIQILPTGRLDVLQRSTGIQARPEPDRQHSWVGWLSPILVITLLLILSWRDIARITSGALFLFADPGAPSARDEGRRMRLLHYAEAVDETATFAPNLTGYLLFQDENLGEAEAAFMKAVNRDPNGSTALNNLAVTYFMTDRSRLAIDLEKKALRNAPDDPILRYNLGLALVAADRQMEALREFKQASYINPAWALPHVQRAYVYLRLQDYLRAEDAAGEAIRLDDSQETAHLVRVIALYNQVKYLEALEAVQRALELDPEDKVALFYKAMILSELQQFDPALAILNDQLSSTKDPAEIARITTEIQAVRHFQEEALAEVP